MLERAAASLCYYKVRVLVVVVLPAWVRMCACVSAALCCCAFLLGASRHNRRVL
jgi:hypothetical protein